MPALVEILLGLVALLVGAEMLVRGGGALAGRLNIPPIIIGITVVSVGTSIPELAVGIGAAWRGEAALAVGNIAGTNMVNLLLILGLSAALRALPISAQTLRLDLPGMVVAAGALVLVSLDGHIATWEGALMVAGSVAYMVLVVSGAVRGRPEVVEEYEEEFTPPPTRTPRRAALLETGILLGGIVIILFGADLLVDGSVLAARTFGVSEAVIGLTVIAIGTSAPELVTTIITTIRDERDIAIGNLIGSSVLNILLILGVTTVVVPGDVPVARELVRIDIPLMFLAAVLCLVVFRSGARVSRGEGVLFVLVYATYLGVLLLLRA